MRWMVAGLLLVLPLTSCAGDDDRETLTVLAAASLTETFTELADAFEDQHPGVDVELVFGSSTTLAEQAADGAPGDVLATADHRSMRLAVDGGVVVEGPETFAMNELVIVTPAGNPADLARLRDLERDDVAWVRCVESAPCGAVTTTLLDSRNIAGRPVSEEIDVKAVLARVVSREADAGLVYRTDAIAAGAGVEAIEIGDGVGTVYEIATLADDARALDFAKLVVDDTGQAVLRNAGFSEVLMFGGD